VVLMGILIEVSGALDFFNFIIVKCSVCCC